MNDTHKLLLIQTLIKTYFSEELQYDETPTGAKKRNDLKKAILDLSTSNL
jgi:hypothetical protein